MTLPPFAQLSERVWRVLGLNPGKFTLQGTNTYLIGRGPRKVLVDCGEGIPEYVPLLVQSLKDISSDAYISDIIISHCHRDHWGGLKDVLSMLPGSVHVHKYPMSAEQDKHRFLAKFPSDIPILPLYDNQVFKLEETTLSILHTPGHAHDHCAFWLEEESTLFSSDCVLGQGTAVFDNLSLYMSDLHRLVNLQPRQIFPGHGPVIKDGIAKLKGYISHREEREKEIIQLLQENPDQPKSVLDIVQVLYKNYPESLHLAAARGVVLHLLKLEKDGKVIAVENYDGDLDSARLLYTKWRYLDHHL